MSTYIIGATSIGALIASIWTLHTYYRHKYAAKLKALSSSYKPEDGYWLGYHDGSVHMKELLIKWNKPSELPEPHVPVLCAFTFPSPAKEGVPFYAIISRSEDERFLGIPECNLNLIGWQHFPRLTESDLPGVTHHEHQLSGLPKVYGGNN